MQLSDARVRKAFAELWAPSLPSDPVPELGPFHPSNLEKTLKEKRKRAVEFLRRHRG